MNVDDKTRLTISVLLVLSMFADILSTIRIKHFSLLEANPLMPYGGFVLITILKVCMNVYLILVLYGMFNARITPNDFSKFFYINVIIILFAGQCFAAVNNYQVGERLKERFDKESVDDFTYEEMESAKLPYDVLSNKYMIFVSSFMIYPLLLSLISFQCWSWCYNERKH